MIQISFWAAAAYCNWLSRAAGLTPVYDVGLRTADIVADGYRLPTEAEWETAARAGYPEESGPVLDACNCAQAGPLSRKLWASETLAGNFLPGHPAPVPVGSLPADRAGLYEMAGNVREWCHDRFGAYDPGFRHNPVGAARGSFRVVRGGAFIDPLEECAPASRMAAYEETKCEVYGFRVACSR